MRPTIGYLTEDEFYYILRRLAALWSMSASCLTPERIVAVSLCNLDFGAY